jgi:REP element-mobilizing transposase RayT
LRSRGTRSKQAVLAKERFRRAFEAEPIAGVTSTELGIPQELDWSPKSRGGSLDHPWPPAVPARVGRKPRRGVPPNEGDKAHRCQITAVTVCRGAPYFFTVNLLKRRADLLVRHIEPLRVKSTRAERSFHIDAWVVLPDHMHCVITLPPGDDDFANCIKAMQIRFVQALPPTEGRSSIRMAKGERGIW